MGMPFNSNFLRAYFVAGSQDVPTGQLPQIVDQAIKAGITAFQYRDKGQSKLSASERENLGQLLRKQCLQAKVPFIVDDDVDLALKLQADGVHVGQKDLAAERVLNIVQQQLFVGLSCETPAQITRANRLTDIAYYGCGAVYPTTSKADVEQVLGVAGLTELVQLANRPVVAIGGITLANLATIPASGAAGVAVISLISQSSDIQKTVTAMRQTFPKAGV